jgi:hypothetical protein
MKRITTVFLLAAGFFVSCNNDKDKTADTPGAKKENTSFTSEESKDGSGSFTVDGTSFNGKVTTQQLAQQQFSVLCENDSPYKILQITFKDKTDYGANASFKPSSGFMTMEAGTAHVSVSGDDEMATKASSTGSIEVSGNTITIKDLKLSNMANDKNVTVSATVTF